jgi:hypothetical protein
MKTRINELQQQVIGVVHEVAPQIANLPLDGLSRRSKVNVVGVIPDETLIREDDASCLLEVPE